MNTLDQDAPEFIYKYGTWDNILFRKLITEQLAYFASPQIYGEEADIRHKIDRSILDENNRFQFYSSHYKNWYPNCSENEISRMAKNALKNNIITEDKLLDFEQRWQKLYYELIGVFCTGLTPYEENLWDEFGNKTKGSKIISGICIKIDTEQAFPGKRGTGKKPVHSSPVSFDPKSILESENASINYMTDFLFTLPAKFCDENEYRIFSLFLNKRFLDSLFNNRIPDLFSDNQIFDLFPDNREVPIPKESIKEIILNAKMGKEKQQEIKECVQSILPDTEIKQLKKRGSEYKLVSI